MRDVLAAGGQVAPLRTNFRLSRDAVALLAVWLVATAVAVFFSLLLKDSSLVAGTYLPRTNDSFYHARRILDAAVGSRGFYQFDTRLHVPEGAWIPWPWAYDYLMAKAVQVAMWLRPGLDPMAFVSYVPVFWILINSSLFLAASGAAGLSLPMRCLAMFCYAVSPFTQLLHGIGMIDHHYMEHTFVLLTLWLGLSWFANPARLKWAVSLGAALGFAQGFHNGLFILQILPLSCIALLWLRGGAPPSRSLYAFGAALLVSTVLVLLPSEPFLKGMFEFGLLSWFHLYIAVCTSAIVCFVARWRFSRTSSAGLLALCVVLVIPLSAQLLSGATFLSGKFSVLGSITEALSPYELFTKTFGPTQTAGYYSWLIVIAPLLLLYYAYRAVRDSAPARLYYALSVVFGLGMLLSQFRFYYMGFFALTTSVLLIVDQLTWRLRWHRGGAFAASFALLTLAYQPALRERLFTVYAPSGDREYANALPIFRKLGELCSDDPGVVLANHDDGNAILFHTDCSVIANNFILRPQDAEKINEVDRLMRMDPSRLGAEAPEVKYLLLRAEDFSLTVDGREQLDADSPVVRKLFSEQPPEGFTKLLTIWSPPAGPGGEAQVYARLYQLDAPSG
jgi:hypothetical protein